MNKIIIIDGNSLLFRAYFATSFTGKIMTTKSGIPTNAIYAFSNMLSKIVSSLKNDEKIFMSFDTGKKTFRHEALDSYKAQRKPIDEELKIQIPIARELLKAMNIFYYELEGYEGDDIAGSVAKLASKNNYAVEIYTSDKDFLQLIDKNIQINMIRKGLNEIEIMNEETLYQKMELLPKQIADFKGLTGDASDNLKGINGIGEKTAIKLLKEYGDLENIISSLENANSKLAQKIKDGKEMGLLCKRLATIKTDIALPFSLEDLEYLGYDFNELSAFYTKYEFISLLKKLKATDKRIVREKKDTFNVTKNYIKRFNELVEKPKSFILDLDGNNYKTFNIKGFVFFLSDECYYLPYDRNNKDIDLIHYLENEKILKSTYDTKSATIALLKERIDLKGIDFDLLLASYLLNSSLDNDPRSIYAYYGFNISESNEEFTLFDNDNQLFNMEYYLEKIKKNCLEELKSINCLKLLYDVELPLAKILADMEYEGFPLNKEVLCKINDKYQLVLNDISERIYALAEDKTLNISSPKQIGDLLFEKLHLPRNKKNSTSIEVLNSLVNLHPIVPLIIEHRKYSKIISTYSNGLTEYILSDNKIHASFNQALTTTGRLSSSEPNLQNISIRNEEGKEVRKAFFYDDENLFLLSLDYSQIELRILASLSNCQGLIDAFNNGKDVHEETARKIFNISDDKPVNESLRRKAKTVNFGIVYGISDWGLAEQLEISIQEAKEIISRFNEHYPEIREYFNNIVDFAKKSGYVETLFHRRRYIKELSSDNYQTREFGKRAAMNAPIQGTAADLIKMAMIKTNNALKENKLNSKLVLQIHDELILKVYDDEKDKVYEIVKNAMENVYQFPCKLEVNGSIGKTWFDAK